MNKIIINRLNEFIINYNQKLIPFTIIFPLKGVRIQIPMEENSYEKICCFKSNVEESGVYIYNNLLIMTSNEITLNSKLIGRNNNIAEGRIGIYDRSEIKFSHLIDPKFLSDQENDDNNINSGLFFYLSQRNQNIPTLLADNPIWQSIKNLFFSMVIYGIDFSMGKPQYIFPWWISNTIAMNFDFPVPKWFISKKVDIEEAFSLIGRRNLIQKGIIPDLGNFLNFLISIPLPIHSPVTSWNMFNPSVILELELNQIN